MPQTDPFAEALAQVRSGSLTPPVPAERPTVLTPQTVGSAALSLLERVTETPGISHILRGLRVPQQALAVGPAEALLTAATKGRVVTPAEMARSSYRAVAEDRSFRQVAQDFGLSGGAGLVLDLVADPLWIVTPAKLAEVAHLPELTRAVSATRPMRALAESRPAQAAGRALIPEFGKPAEFVQMGDDLRRAVSISTERALDIGKRIGALVPEEQRAVRAYMEVGTDGGRQVVLQHAETSGMDATRIGELGAEAMQRDIELGQQLTDVGLMKPEVFERWRGKHIRREYLKHENPTEYLEQLAARDPEAAAKLESKLKTEAGFQGGTAPLRERLAFLKQRQDIPEDIRREMGEILEAAHPVAHGQALAGRAVAMRQFFNEVKGKFAVDTAEPGYKFAGDSASLGPLAGTYLPHAIADDITDLVARPAGFARAWKTGVGWWKYGKVVLNPATHARNIMSNFILADMAGLAPYKIHRYAQGLRSLVTHDEWYREAKEAGTFLLDTFRGTELPKLLTAAPSASAWRRSLTMAVAPIRRAGDAYQAEEQLFKMAFYIDRRKAGLAAPDAAKLAEQALFNYRKVPRLIANLRSYGVVPFLTFPYKAVPAFGRALAKRPAAINRYGNIFRIFEAPGAETERKVLPEYMQDGWMRLPDTDADGRVRYLNLNYILPFGDIGEAATLGGYLGRGGQKSSFLSLPMADLASAVVSGRDAYTDQEIEKQPGGWTGFLTNFMLPPLAGGYASKELIASAKGQPTNPLSRTAEPRSLSQALLANLAGLRIRPLDLQQERRSRIAGVEAEIRDLRTEMRRWQRSKWITTEERDDQLAEQVERLKVLMREIREFGELKLPASPK